MRSENRSGKGASRSVASASVARWHDDTPVRIGVSACLLGHAVRWDGGDKRDNFVCDVLDRYVEWVPVCPEVELGLPVPRAALGLWETRDGTRLMEAKTGRDFSDAMRRFAASRMQSLGTELLCGYLFKARSPSCGLNGVDLRDDAGGVEPRGRGVFAAALLSAYPTLPVEEESRLHDAEARDHFIERVFAAHRLRSLFSKRWTREELAAFHAAHELQLMAHSESACRSLERLAGADEMGDRDLREQYQTVFSSALAKFAGWRNHAKVLEHIAEVFGDRLGPAGRREILDRIEHYRNGQARLADVRTWFRQQLDFSEGACPAGQVYLEPFPSALALASEPPRGN